jgi:dUTP pyrophosphatase
MFILDIEICNPELLSHYKSQIMVLERTYNYMSSDSGFDLYLPKDYTIGPGESKMIDLEVKVEPNFAGGYYLYPRSSISKYPLRLKNSVGIIDNSYRGNLKCAVENTSQTETVELRKGERYFQLCHPTLIAMKAKIVEKVTPSKRGEGGFGSTGK